VLAHDRKLDLPALEVALRAGCRFIGQIGGRRTQRLRREGLADLGIEKSDIARVRGPVGLDIGSDTPEEIALAILAEIVAVQHGKA
jgi:xanthine dehydrogenase accessory factor